jgi:hypothetical protein
MTQRKPALATRVSPYVNNAVRRLTTGLGITISEYLRKLILQDLESRRIFDDELKKAVMESEPHIRKRAPKENIIELFRKRSGNTMKNFRADKS